LCDNRHARPLERDGRKELAPALAATGRLDDGNLDGLVDLVVGPHRPEESTAIEKAGVDVLQEVGRGDRRAHDVDLGFYLTRLGLDDDADGSRHRLSVGA
jgi:hypothetical protein